MKVKLPVGSTSTTYAVVVAPGKVTIGTQHLLPQPALVRLVLDGVIVRAMDVDAMAGHAAPLLIAR